MKVRLKSQKIRLSALGDCAIEVFVGFPSEDGVIERVQVLTLALKKQNVNWLLDIVPAYGTVAVFYDPIRIPSVLENSYDWLCAWIKEIALNAGVLARRTPTVSKKRKPVEIPVCYDKSLGEDLERVAAKAKLSLQAYIKLHSSTTYRVQAVGFAPGFPYLAGLSPKLSAPRLETPRERVPAGSVGIGGSQTGIYPFSTPGGWNLIGQTPLRLFDLNQTPPALLAVGDEVIFRPISKEEFLAWK
jgi:inhibitor of KinA